MSGSAIVDVDDPGPMKIQEIGHVTFISFARAHQTANTKLPAEMAGSLLPPEKLGELRQLIHGHVSEAGVQEQIRTALSEILSQHGGRYSCTDIGCKEGVYPLSHHPPFPSFLPLCRTLDEATLLEALEERGIIEQVMATLNLGRIDKSEKPDQSDERREAIKTEGGRREESLVSPQHLHPRSSSPDGKRRVSLNLSIVIMTV